MSLRSNKINQVSLRRNHSIMPKVKATKTKKPYDLSSKKRQVRSIRSKRKQEKVSNISSKGRNDNEQNIDDIRNQGRGKVCLIVANGPSHKEVDLEKIAELDNLSLITVNKPDDRIWPTDYWVFCDNSQLRRHEEYWKSYNGYIINTASIKKTKPNSILLKTKNSKGFSYNLHKGVHIGRSSTYVAMQTALWMDFEHTFVIGCDMGRGKNGQLYPWGSNPDVQDDVREKRFKEEADHMKWFTKNVPEDKLHKYTFLSAYNKWPFTEDMHVVDHNESYQLIKDKIDKLLSEPNQK